ncbi:Uncharacterized protein conserved in bacteria [Trueperella bialowiezensis]|uniref:Uncharacterized protein conserved in bacteria n=2 Tax=Trueperella bialowiezensis TaxID=312285 RepID=A0A448PDP0_9ACTO|nr:Uncharacterized protein conserved in bacteria [Trueperella bialowiezensis]
MNEPPKPGSRRARRLAEREAARAAAEATTANEGAATATKETAIRGAAFRAPITATPDTAEIPQVKRVTVKGGTPYAETMNYLLVTSRVNAAPVAAPRQYSKSRQLLSATSVLVVATGAAIAAPLMPTRHAPAELAVAAVANPVQDETPVAAAKITFDVTVDGTTTPVTAPAGSTYAGAFAEAGIEIGPNDEVSVALTDQITAAPVTIVRVTTATVTEDFTTEHETERVDDPDLAKGEEVVETQGADGTGTRSYEVTYRDGQESSRTLLIEAVRTEPVTHVVRVGTKEVVEPEAAPASGSHSVPVPASAPVPAGSAREIAQGMLASYGWGMDQWSCLDALWQRESNWNTYAANPSSGAYGIPQALPGSKMASAGADWQTNPATQIRWGLGYIQGRYGSPCGAWGHSQSRGWY